MDCHLESLRNENRRLKGKHNELQTNLTEEKEMVKYLHGVIKNYQQLLKKPEQTRHLKPASIRSVRRSSSARSQIENSAEERFIKKFAEMKDAPVQKKSSERMEMVGTIISDAPGCANSVIDSIQAKSSAGEEDVIARNKFLHAKPTVVNSDDEHIGSRAQNRWDLTTAEEQETASKANGKEKQTEQSTNTNDILQELFERVDAMMDTAVKHEKSLERKDKHLMRMQRRLEYLESIAFGEESEWL